MNSNVVLAKYGLAVYDKPQPHIPLEDLKLALGATDYNDFAGKTHEFVSDGSGIIGVTPQTAIDYLINH